MNQQKYFLAQGPGSIEWYLIPTEERYGFIEWCKAELFDDVYTTGAAYFKQWQLVDGQHNEREFIIV